MKVEFYYKNRSSKNSAIRSAAKRAAKSLEGFNGGGKKKKGKKK